MASDVIFDKRDQLDKIREVLLEGERVQAVFDLKGAQTGFVGLTDRRLIIYDKDFLGGRKAMVSIPYKHIVALGSEDEGGLLRPAQLVGSKLVIQTAAHNIEMEFRGREKAHWAYQMILGRML